MRAAGFLRNSLDLDDVVYARNSREHNLILTETRRDRTSYLYCYDRQLRVSYLYRMIARDESCCLLPVPSQGEVQAPRR